MRRIFYLSLVINLGFISCKSDSEDGTVDKKIEVNESQEFTGIEVLFDESKFADPKMPELLKEIKICGDNPSNDPTITDCSPENFKFFNLNDSIALENGFILITKANTGGIALRRVLVFERERGVLTKVNGFVANLIGKRKSDSGYDDLLLRFKDVLEGSDIYYNCLFSWSNGKYSFKSVEVIEEPTAGWRGHVKEENKDSVSKEIYQTIVNNQMIF